ncbi:MAG: hypothetical protein AAGI63_01450 [Planctomycetota bacterium]
MQFALLGLLIVLLIGFFVVVWKASSDWRWYNIVAVCFIMLLVMIFLFPTAGVLQSRQAWHKIKEDLERRIEDVREENRTLKYGDATDPSAGEGALELDRKLLKIGIETGRRWRNLRMQSVANNQVVLVDQTALAAAGVPGDPNAPAEPAAAADGVLVTEQSVVYGFAEEAVALPGQTNQVPLPTFYLGEFRVVSSTATQVTIAPLTQLEPIQLQAINNQPASWSLYELLPLDSHLPFLAEGSLPSDENFLGRVNEDLIRRLLEGRVTDDTLNEYLRDGGSRDSNDPELTKWTMIEFIEDYQIQVDSPDQPGILEGGFFDGSGRALDSRLKRAEADNGVVRFKKTDRIVVKIEAANQIIDQGVAEIRNEYFVRPLNDYRYALRRIRQTLDEVRERTAEFEREKVILDKAIARTVAMIGTNQVIRDKLEQDLTQFTAEAKAVTDYADKLQKGREEMRAEMSRLHRENIALEKRLAEIQLTIQRRMDAVTVAP